MALPFITAPQVRSNDFRPIMRFFYWIFVAVSCILGWIGSKPIVYPFLIIGQTATVFYFALLLVIFPLIALIERRLWK